MRLLHVSAPGCHLQGVSQNREIYANHIRLGVNCPVAAFHVDRHHTLRLDEVTSNRVRSRRASVCVLRTDHKQLRTYSRK